MLKILRKPIAGIMQPADSAVSEGSCYVSAVHFDAGLVEIVRPAGAQSPGQGTGLDSC